MPDLQDLVRYENENSALDFKAVQYRKEAHEALLKDIVSMANANVQGDRHIVIAVKHRPDGSREFLGIDAMDFVDPAVYQDLVRANIEPDLEVDYLRLDVGGCALGVIRISGCENPPYMMKKDFGSLRMGDGFIRKGSHQARLTRSDLDRMIARKTAVGPKDTDLIVSLDPHEPRERLTIDPLVDISLPSARAAAKIKAILAEREEKRQNPALSKHVPAVLAGITMPSILGGRPYHLRLDDELRKNLEEIEETYREDDLYELYEEFSFKLNIYITNTGDRYVEDAGIELAIPAEKGLLVADRIYQKPSRSFPYDLEALYGAALPYTYPLVQSDAESFLIRDQIGEIKHQRTTDAFRDAVRMVIGPDLAGRAVQLTCRIHAKNLRVPATRTLTLVVADRGTDS